MTGNLFIRKISLAAMFTFFFCGLISAQTDWQRWEPAKVTYEKKATEDTLKFDDSSVASFFISSMKNAYSFFWSDHDGDNCPFHPTCSRFFVTSVKETNIIKGTLMFADRFTRDANLFKSADQYGFYFTGRLNDPVQKYTLDQDSVYTYFKSQTESK